MKSTNDRSPASTAFIDTKDMTSVSYVPDRSSTTKKVVLLSTMHKQGDISDGGKPEIIEYYNKTKGGVDMFDQMTTTYTTSRKTRSWQLSVVHKINTPSLARELKLLISKAFKIPLTGTTADTGGPVAAESACPSVRCRDFPKSSDRKTRHKCHLCKRPVCPRHYYPVCSDCIYLKVIDSNFYSKSRKDKQ
ncbi:hypothetical protein Pcinc_012347 [Petrolisthes cinctipes]|uniref:PiggyBac transposable element-derived protein domain-containing protein n=1 Tax=Petrolisthes cinctipes TaxID=88211 RepID=A0AAE1G138_PETCI|nr:hypothetical protein Pcinc_012347 [Petrolisthes cinctipes]